LTGDIDFWVRIDSQNAEKLVNVIEAFGFASLGLVADDFLESDRVVQLGDPPRRIDILTKLTALEFDHAWANRQTGDLDGIPVHFLSREDFLVNKRATGRAKDLADVEAVELN
jgi:hypothetical protein